MPKTIGCSTPPTRLGYAVGAGVEWGLTDQLSLKAEYLHVGFGRFGAGQTGTNIAPQTFARSAALNSDFFRVGLNYKLGELGTWFAAGMVSGRIASDRLGVRSRVAGLAQFRRRRRVAAVAQ
jgi:hypothetical protein